MIIEKLTKSYLTVGRDLTVLIQLFKTSGKVDAVLIDNNDLKPHQLLTKVQANRYG